jgi:hypothetical protein
MDYLGEMVKVPGDTGGYGETKKACSRLMLSLNISLLISLNIAGMPIRHGLFKNRRSPKLMASKPGDYFSTRK